MHARHCKISRFALGHFRFLFAAPCSRTAGRPIGYLAGECAGTDTQDLFRVDDHSVSRHFSIPPTLVDFHCGMDFNFSRDGVDILEIRRDQQVVNHSLLRFGIHVAGPVVGRHAEQGTLLGWTTSESLTSPRWRLRCCTTRHRQYRPSLNPLLSPVARFIRQRQDRDRAPKQFP